MHAHPRPGTHTPENAKSKNTFMFQKANFLFMNQISIAKGQ